jgi:hypothetical protein
MGRKTHAALVVLLAVVVLGVFTPQAAAIYPQLSGRLTGPAIGGITPEGDAKVDQSRLPSVPPRLEVRVKNVNLPDGTVLFVGLGCEYHSCVDYRKAGTFTLSGRQGSHTAWLQVSVGRQDRLIVSTGNSTVVLSMTEPWKA